jgi:hypothetical protein
MNSEAKNRKKPSRISLDENPGGYGGRKRQRSEGDRGILSIAGSTYLAQFENVIPEVLCTFMSVW